MAGMMVSAPLAPMRKAEARGLVQRIRASLRDCRQWLLDLYEREGWRSLGYSSWRECCSIEFSTSVSRCYQLLQAARVERDFHHGRKESVDAPIPERQLRELAKLPTAELRAEVYAEATADGDTSAAEIRELVREHEGHARTEKLRIVNDGPAEDDVEQAPAPPQLRGRDPVAVILLRCQDARRYHRDLGGRARAADTALDSYLAIVRGE